MIEIRIENKKTDKCNMGKALKFFLSVIALVLSTSSIHSEKSNIRSAKQPDWDKYEIKGKVKEVRYYNMKESDGKRIKGEMTKVIKFDATGKEIETRCPSYDGGYYGNIHKYDSKGNKIEIYSYDCNKDGEIQGAKETYSYDLHGNMLDSCIFDIDDKLIEMKAFKYDSNGNRIECRDSLGEDIVDLSYYQYDKKGYRIGETIDFHASMKQEKKWKYDAKGNMIEMVLERNGEFDTKYTYEFDDKGNMTEERMYFGSRLELDHRITFRYDSNSNRIEYCFYGYTGDLSFKVAYEYDENGKMIDRYAYDEKESLKETLKKKYDKKGNLIESNLFNSGGILIYETTYKYDKKGNQIESVDMSEGHKFSKGTITEYDYY